MPNVRPILMSECNNGDINILYSAVSQFMDVMITWAFIALHYGKHEEY